ncbi:MAG TPA: hypothetical protein VH137_02720, partial [Gemmatimonadales bacterium]|nr:hypothetical protein [Gemmatimonadales bacterium]
DGDARLSREALPESSGSVGVGRVGDRVLVRSGPSMNAGRTLLVTGLLLCCAARAGAQGERLKLYGFFDTELHAANQPGGPPWSFDQHHVNVVSIYNLDAHWRVFTEVEWEHAALVQLEQGVLEFKHTDALQLKVGKFLPPFGLYNLRRDATPTFLSVAAPNAIYGEHSNPMGLSQLLVPEFGTGLAVLGNAYLRGWQGEYAAYVTNGRGPEAAGQASNQAKGLGGRLVLHAPGDALQLGLSYYADRNGDASDTRQRAIGFDALARYADFVVEAEALAPRLEQADSAGRPNGRFRTGRAYYLQLSHLLGEALTPFARYEYYDPDTGFAAKADRDVVLGLNLAATRAVLLKGEVHLRTFQDPTQARYQQFVGAAAVAF